MSARSSSPHQLADQRRTIPILWNLWLLFACFLCGAIFVAAVTISLSVQSREMRQPALSSTFAEAARMAYESGGKEKFQEMIERLRKLNVNLHLLDTNGRDLVDRQDYSRLLTKANPSIGRASFSGETGSFTYLIVPALGDDYLTFWIKMLPLLAVLAFLAAGIVWYVAFRMRRLETALSRFGAGDLQIRMPADTRDSIGRLSRAFNQMADRIESLVHAQRRLCIDISHELRSPLARLRLAAGLARSSTRGALNQIEMEVMRLDDLLSELLNVARAEADPATLRPESVDLRWLLAEIVDECSIEAVTHSCEIEPCFEGECVVEGDPELLRRAIENVLRNAIRYSPANSSIQVLAKRDRETALISIRDHGPGVPDSALEKLFDAFYRVQPEGAPNTGGAGLGLSIAQRAIAVHGGSIHARNAQPGLCVEIRLPGIRNGSANSVHESDDAVPSFE